MLLIRLAFIFLCVSSFHCNAAQTMWSSVTREDVPGIAQKFLHQHGSMLVLAMREGFLEEDGSLKFSKIFASCAEEEAADDGSKDDEHDDADLKAIVRELFKQFLELLKIMESYASISQHIAEAHPIVKRNLGCVATKFVEGHLVYCDILSDLAACKGAEAMSKIGKLDYVDAGPLGILLDIYCRIDTDSLEGESEEDESSSDSSSDS